MTEERVELYEEGVGQLLNKALEQIEEAMKSQLWSYTREHELGRLDVAKYAIKAVLEDL